MLWSLNLVLKATVRGARDSRVTLLIGLCWHQARPTSTKAAVAHFSPPRPAGPGVHKHFHPLRAGPPGRMITLMDVTVLRFLSAHAETGHPLVTSCPLLLRCRVLRERPGLWAPVFRHCRSRRCAPA